jgi:hypothetical protein
VVTVYTWRLSMNLPIYFHPRLNTQDVLNKLSLGPARRILLDKSGESKRPPFTNFNDLVTHHAIQKRKAEAEGYMSLRR